MLEYQKDTFGPYTIRLKDIRQNGTMILEFLATNETLTLKEFDQRPYKNATISVKEFVQLGGSCREQED